jgi:hypothetical protein
MIGKIQRVERQTLKAYDIILRHWRLQGFEEGSRSSLQTAKQVYPKTRNRNPVSGRPGNWSSLLVKGRQPGPPCCLGPKTELLQRSSVLNAGTIQACKGLLSRSQGCSSLAQDCTATAQGCLLIAQVKTAGAQVWKRKRLLGRSFFADDYMAWIAKEEAKFPNALMRCNEEQLEEHVRVWQPPSRAPSLWKRWLKRKLEG